MIAYNQEAWAQLRKQTQQTMSGLLDVIHSLGIDVCTNTFTNWRRDGTIPPDALVRICNHFHFPVSYFFRIVRKDYHENGPRNYDLIDDDKWEDIKLVTSNIKGTFRPQAKRQEIIKTLGCSLEYYHAMLRYPNDPLPARLSLRVLIKYLNKAKIYAGDIFIDHNVFIPMERNTTPFIDQKAKNYYYAHIDKPMTSEVAEDDIDIVVYLMKYVSHTNLEGDDVVVPVTNKVLNEIANIISGLRNDVINENQLRLEAEEKVAKLTAKLQRAKLYPPTL